MTNTFNNNECITSNTTPWAAFFRPALVYSLMLSSLILGNPAFAVYPFNDAEWAMLPEYCRHQGNVSENHTATNSEEWRKILGPQDYEHIHHWCAVYMWMGRAYKAGVGSHEGQEMLRRAEADTGYFMKRMAPNSPRAAEVYTRLGEVYLLQGKPGQAEAPFKRAHQIDPARWQPYFFWANYLRKQGRTAEARKELAAGLEQTPDNKALKSLLVELDSGRKSDQK